MHVKGNSKNMVKVLKQSSISLPSKTQGVNRLDYKGTTNTNPVNGIQAKISS